MGNQSAKSGGAKNLFTSDEMKALETAFRSAVGSHSEKITKEKLVESWSAVIDAHLAECTAKFLYNTTGLLQQQQHQQQQRAVPIINILRFGEPYYIVEHGTIDQKLNFLAGSLEKSDSNQFAIKELEKYVAAVCKSYLNMHEHHTSNAYDSWKLHGYRFAERTIFAFAKGLIRGMLKDNEHYFNLDQLEHWLSATPIFTMLWSEVFIFLYSKHTDKSHKLGNVQMEKNILPVIEGIPTGTNYTPLIDIPHVIFINSNLPNEMRHKWRFLFSSKIMGESFSTMLGKIIEKGPTLFLVEDEDRFIFGGYAPANWSLCPNFVGDETSVLLTLSPAMRCFTTTGYNDHYQYLNINQQTMPNGLGMGGQFNYWGLWIDCDYGLGQSSETCTTYRDYVQLSKRKEFRIRNLEVWGVGDEPKVEEDDEVRPIRSILDKNLEDRVILELSGKQMQSDGVREPDLDL